MLISQVKQLTAVDGWIDFNGQIKECKDIKQRTKSQLSQNPGQPYNVQKLIIQDGTDSISGWAYADKQFLPGMRVSVHGMLKEHMGTKYFDYADVKTQQSAQNNAQQAAQGTNSSPSVQNPQRNQDNSSFRIKALECASRAIRATEGEAIGIAVKLLDIAAPLAKWIENGQAPTFDDFDQFAQDNPVENDDIPEY
jgi:hypothetical protein